MATNRSDIIVNTPATDPSAALALRFAAHVRQSTLRGSSSAPPCRRINRHRYTQQLATRGLTLIEMVIVIVLIGVLASVGSVLITHFVSSAATQYTLTDNSGKALFAMARMQRDITGMAANHASSIKVMKRAQLNFVDSRGHAISYKYSGHTLSRNGQLLANNIRSMRFSYYNVSGKVTRQPGAVRYINIHIVAGKDNLLSSFATTIWPRSFKHDYRSYQ